MYTGNDPLFIGMSLKGVQTKKRILAERAAKAHMMSLMTRTLVPVVRPMAAASMVPMVEAFTLAAPVPPPLQYGPYLPDYSHPLRMLHSMRKFKDWWFMPDQKASRTHLARNVRKVKASKVLRLRGGYSKPRKSRVKAVRARKRRDLFARAYANVQARAAPQYFEAEQPEQLVLQPEAFNYQPRRNLGQDIDMEMEYLPVPFAKRIK